MLNRRSAVKYGVSCLASLLIIPSKLLAKPIDDISDFEKQLQRTLIDKLVIEHNKIKNDYTCNECSIDFGIQNYKNNKNIFYYDIIITSRYKNHKKTTQEWEKYYKYMAWLVRKKPTTVDNIPVFWGGTWQANILSFEKPTYCHIYWQKKYNTRFNINKNRLLNNIKKELSTKYNIDSTIEIFNDVYTNKYYPETCDIYNEMNEI